MKSSLLFFILIFSLSFFKAALGIEASSSRNLAQESASKKLTCQYLFVKENLCFTFTWEVIPQAPNDPGQILLRTFVVNNTTQISTLKDPSGSPRLELWMNDGTMNHGSSITKTERIEPGVFRISNIIFTMHGDWLLRFQILQQNSILDEAEIPLSF